MSQFFKEVGNDELEESRQKERSKQEFLLRKKHTNLVDAMHLQMISLERQIESAEKLALNVFS